MLAESKVEAPKPGQELNAPTEGTVLWQAPAAGRLLAGSDKRLYCLDELGRMSILRRSDGGHVDSLALPGHQLAVHNDMTDRIYIGTRSGTIQCLHEAGIDKPLKHRRDPSQKPVVKEAKQKALDSEPKEKAKGEGKGKDADIEQDLFGGEKKPAKADGAEEAAPKKEAAAEEDAFGGAAKEEAEKKEPEKKEPPKKVPADEDTFGS